MEGGGLALSRPHAATPLWVRVCGGVPYMHGAASSEGDITMTKVSPRPSPTLPGCSSRWRTRWHHRLPRTTSRSRGGRSFLLEVLIHHHVGNFRICFATKIFPLPSVEAEKWHVYKSFQTNIYIVKKYSSWNLHVDFFRMQNIFLITTILNIYLLSQRVKEIS